MIANPPIACKAVGAYIYICTSKKLRIAYVGQTHAKAGVVARMAQHVRPNGTLQKNLAEIGLAWEDADDWQVHPYELPAEQVFLSLETSYREAVEYLVQMGLYTVPNRLTPPLRFVSSVKSSPHIKKRDIIELAEKIIHRFILDYNKL